MAKKKFDGVLFLTDLDCTVLKNDKTLSKKNKDAIEYFKENGGLFTAATGRSTASARTIIPLISPNAPAILFNGALIYDYDAGRAIYKDMADEREMRGLINELMAAFPKSGIEVYSEDGIFLSRGNHVTDEHVVLAKLDFSYKPINDIPGPYFKTIILDEPDVLKSVERYVEEKKVFERYQKLSAVYSESRLFEFVKNGVSKGSALKNTYAIGDNQNDVEMIRDAGFGFAVANSVKEALDAADMVVSDNEHDAVAEAIEFLDSKY